MLARLRTRAKDATSNPLLPSAAPAIVRQRHPRTGALEQRKNYPPP